MFNLHDFIFNNLVSGYKNGSFTKEQVSIYSVNYMTKGLFTETDVENLNEILSEEPADSVMDEEIVDNTYSDVDTPDAEITAEETSDFTVESAKETTTGTNDCESVAEKTEQYILKIGCHYWCSIFVLIFGTKSDSNVFILKVTKGLEAKKMDELDIEHILQLAMRIE